MFAFLVACGGASIPASPAPMPIGPRCVDVAATTTVRIKVMTINLRHDNDQWQRRFELVADEIARLDPDVIGTQELEISRDQVAVLNRLLVARGHAPYASFTRRKAGMSGYMSGEGIGILSRWPIESSAYVDLGEERVGVFVRVRHPSGGALDVFDTHLDQHGKADGINARDREALNLTQLIAEQDACNPTILTGDFNSIETGLPMKRFIAAGFEDSFRALHAEPAYTAPVILKDGAFEQAPKLRIDYILARNSGARTLKPIESIVVFENHDAKGFYPSDHFGVMTTFDVAF